MEQGKRRIVLSSSLLSRAAAQGDLGILKHLLARGVRVNNPKALLTEAVRGGNPELLGFLMILGPDIEKDHALVQASFQGKLDMVKLLVALGADVNTDDGLALSSAVDRGHFSVVRYLVSQGADVKEDAPELLLTASHTNIPMFEYLLEAFDPTITSVEDIPVASYEDEFISDEADLHLQNKQLLPSILTVGHPLSSLISGYY